MAMEHNYSMIFLLKPQFRLDFQLPRLIAGGYVHIYWLYLIAQAYQLYGIGMQTYEQACETCPPEMVCFRLKLPI